MRQTVCKQLCHHGNARFRYTVFATVDGGGIGGNGGDVNDAWVIILLRLKHADHLPRHRLAHEKGALQVGIQHEIEAFLCGFQQIEADFRCDACIVDKHIHPAELGEYFVCQRTNCEN